MRHARRAGREHLTVARLTNAFGLVLLLVLATFVAQSLVPFKDWGAVVITALSALSATVALASTGLRHPVVTWLRRAAAFGVLLAVIGAIAGGRAFFATAALIQAVLLLISSFAVLRAVLTEDRVGFRTILGAVSVYISLGLLFTFVYVSIERVAGDPFFGPAAHVDTGDFVFFSMTTLTTTGYGNLVPAFQPGKMFAVLEMLMGQVFLVTLIARLVSMWEPGRFLRSGGGLVEAPVDRDRGRAERA
jgi:Ion channel